MTTEITSTIITSLSSIVAIFVSNYLGRKAKEKEITYNVLDRHYKTLYLPLIYKIIHNYNNEFLNYHWMVAFDRYARKNPDFLEELLKNNFYQLPLEVVKIYPDYIQNTSNCIPFFWGDDYDYFYLNKLEKASELFDEIIILLLKEGSKLSKKLELPDLSKHALSIFLQSIETQKEDSRALPISVRKGKLKLAQEPF